MPATPPSGGAPGGRRGRLAATPRSRRRGGRAVLRPRAATCGSASPFTVIALNGERHPLYVRGIADTADQGFYPEWTPGLAWVLPETLDRVEPDAGPQRVGDRAAPGRRRGHPGRSSQRRRRHCWTTRSSASTPGARSGPPWSWTTGCSAAAGAVRRGRAGRRRARAGQRGRRAGARPAPRPGHAQVHGLHPGPGRSACSWSSTARSACSASRSARCAGWALRGGAARRRPAVAPMPVLAIVAGTALVVLAAVGLPAWRGGRTPPIPAAPAAAARAATCRGWPGSPCWYGCRPRSSWAPGTPSPGGCPRS